MNSRFQRKGCERKIDWLTKEEATMLSELNLNRKTRILLLLAGGIAVMISLGGLSVEAAGESAQKGAADPAKPMFLNLETLDQLTKLPGDLGPLPTVPIPLDNPSIPAKVELGKMLFFDPRLSVDRSMSCATCHDPQKGYSDGRPRSIGFGGKELGRHSPTVINIAYNSVHFWDGRAPNMEEQAQGPILASGEMNMKADEVAHRLNNIPEYKKRFQEVFGEGPTLPNVGKAIAAFERTIVTGDSAFDHYMKGKKKALTDQEKKGLILFIGKAACSQCHNGPNLTDNQFYKLGVPQVGPLKEDDGRFEVTRDEKDRGAFKTPTLRNITMTAPYMHNGALQTLEEVIEFYNKGGGSVPGKSPKILKLNLTSQERKDLASFLRALTGELPVVTMSQLPEEN
jgi:cytochrome c peroxidase